MPRVDHVALESSSPEALAAFYERALGARIVRDEDGSRARNAITYRGGGDARR